MQEFEVVLPTPTLDIDSILIMVLIAAGNNNAY